MTDRFDEQSPPSASRRAALTGSVAILGGVAAALSGAASAAPTASDQAREGSMTQDLNGKTAVVTGAARGIGRATAVALAQAGANVVGIDIAARASPATEYAPATPADLAETGRRVEAAGRRWNAIRADTRDLPALRRAAEAVDKAFGGADIVFANAGIQAFAPILETDDARWHDQIDVNLSGTANTLRAFAPGMARRGKGGRFILTASSQGRQGFRDGSAYAASKWGIIGLMKSAALELGAHQITVNVLVPGLIDTEMTRNERRYLEFLKTVQADPPAHPTRETTAPVRARTSPLGVPWLAPEDMAPMVVFLAGDTGRLITGATFDVTAGDTAHYTA